MRLTSTLSLVALACMLSACPGGGGSSGDGSADDGGGGGTGVTDGGGTGVTDGGGGTDIDYAQFGPDNAECTLGETQACRCTQEAFTSEQACTGFYWGPCQCADEGADYSLFVVQNENPDDPVFLVAQGDQSGETIALIKAEDEQGARLAGVHWSDGQGAGFTAYIDETGRLTEVLTTEGAIVRYSNYETLYVDIEVISPNGVVESFPRSRIEYQMRDWLERVEAEGLYLDLSMEKADGDCGGITSLEADLAINLGTGLVTAVGCAGAITAAMATVNPAVAPIVLGCGSAVAAIINEIAQSGNRGTMHGTSVGLDLAACVGHLDAGGCLTGIANFVRSACYDPDPDADDLDNLCVPKAGGTVCDGGSLYYRDSCGSRTELALRCPADQSCATGECGCQASGVVCNDLACADRVLGYCGGATCNDVGECECPSVGECGDGVLSDDCDNYEELEEQCDPNLDRSEWSSVCGPDDICSGNCHCISVRTLCQNDVWDQSQGEECDFTAEPSGCGFGMDCTTTCECQADCGDGVIATGVEECDYNAEPTGCGGGATCNRTSCECESDGTCGNGVLDDGEECGEPGHTDCGSATCIDCGCCGDGNIDVDEGCDEGDRNTNVECEPDGFAGQCTYCTTECVEVTVGTPTAICDWGLSVSSDDDEDWEDVRFCNVIPSSVFISGDVTHLSGLSHITHIQGNLVIYSTTALTSLTALSGVDVDGQIDIKDNEALTDVTLSGISGEVEWIRFNNNPQLSTISGFSGVTRAGSLSVGNNPKLTDLSVFSSIEFRGLSISRNDLTTASFRVGGGVGGGLTVNREERLTSLTITGDPAVTGWIDVSRTALTSISIPATTAVAVLIDDNTQLTSLSFPNLETLGPPPGANQDMVKLRGNNLLDGPETWFPSLRTVDGNVDIGAAAVTELGNLAPNLSHITGSLEIGGQFKACEAQAWADGITIDGTVHI